MSLLFKRWVIFFFFLVCYQLIDSMFAQIEAASMKYADVIEMLLLMMADF